MRFSYEWLKEVSGSKLSRAGMVDVLNRFSFDTEPSGSAGIEIKVPPNRIGDASGHLGVAKEIAGAAGKRAVLPQETYAPARFSTRQYVSVRVQDAHRCPRYMALYAELGKVRQAPGWMQKRMKACGVRPINAVVDIMNYVMLEYGQPLHAFDYGKLAGREGAKQIIVRKAKKGEHITTIENKTYTLSGDELLICDAEAPHAIAGVKGGKDAEIDARTTRIVVEAANFNAVAIRKTSRLLGIRTDASVRFENGMDPNLAEAALRRVGNLLGEVCRARIANSWVDVYPVKTLARPLKVSLTDMEHILGMRVPSRRAEQIFSMFCKTFTKLPNGAYRLVIDTARRDIASREDVAEEIGRFIGYGAIPATTVPEGVVPAVLSNELNRKWAIQDALVALGFDEVMNYSLVKGREIARLGIDQDKVIKVTKPVSGMYEYLRPSLLVGLLRNVADNARYFNAFQLFEIGKVFSKAPRSGAGGDVVPSETPMLGLVIYGASSARNAMLDMKGVLEALVRSLGIDPRDCQYVPEPSLGHWGAYGASLAIGKHAGAAHLGIMKPELCAQYDIHAPVAYAEVALDPLWRMRNPKTFREIPKYPSVLRDISLFASPQTAVQSVAQAMRSAGARTLEQVELFDVFEKDGKKGMSFHLEFRSLQRTLTDSEVDAEVQDIVRALQERGFTIR